MTPEERAEEWGKILWQRGVIDNFKKLDEKIRYEVRYYFSLSLHEFIQRCLRHAELKNNKLLLEVLTKNAIGITEEFQKADEEETKEKK